MKRSKITSKTIAIPANVKEYIFSPVLGNDLPVELLPPPDLVETGTTPSLFFFAEEVTVELLILVDELVLVVLVVELEEVVDTVELEVLSVNPI